MNEEEAQSIVASVWTLNEYIGKDHKIDLAFHLEDKHTNVEISIRDKNKWENKFEHVWQTGDTVESFLEALNVRVNSIFDLEA